MDAQALSLLVSGLALGVGAVIAVAVVLLVRRMPARTSAPTGPEGTLHSQQLVDASAETVALERRRGELARLGDDLERRELRLAERESTVDADARLLDERAAELADLDEDLDRRGAELAELAADLDRQRREALAAVAGMSADQARDELMARVEHDAKLAAAHTVREIERSACEEGEARARRILTTAMQRLAAQQTADATVTALPLPSDEFKGRIIGREGRNVRAFEQLTGVNLIIDDTPSSVLLSCFDPVRREVARLSLQELVADGRIHPARIEEVHSRQVLEVERLCLRAGQDAALKAGITDLAPELVHVLGQLRYRTSYGQNVLAHLSECAQLAELMAAEIGLDPALCTRAALLHDLGKALTHQSSRSHALVGADLARRHGESDDVVHAIEAHHNEVEPRTVEAVLVQAADAISGSRPGARRESLETYVQRLEALERIAHAMPGVQRVFAMQAGREVRVMVQPLEVDDIQAQVLARDIAKQVEQELTYPGQIKVTVIRESRTTEVAR